LGKIDRYLLSQLLVMFGFFALVLVAIFWINRAVLLFDRLIGDGQSAFIFLEFTALGLPKLITTVLPIAGFAAAVYITNRLNSDSELTVMQATGSSPFRLARPVLIFGGIVFCMASVLTHFLLPMAQAQLVEREAEISQNVSARLLTEGTFLTPSPGVTFYARAIGADGVLRDVFMSDRRDPAEGVIYTASEAYLVRASAGTTLIMVDGMAQRFTTQDERLATANFADFSFDISALVNNETERQTLSRNLTTPVLMAPWDDVMELTDQSRGVIAEEFHTRFAEPLFCIVAAMVGFSTLLVGGYSRFGIWREVVIAFGLLLLLDGIGGAVQDPVRSSSSLWPMLYLPVALGTVLALGMLSFAANPALLRRRRLA
jgi:lipopolysaccharide export system permease protein